MTVNGVSISPVTTAASSRRYERWLDLPDHFDPVEHPVAHTFEAVVSVDPKTGEYRLEHLRAEVYEVD